MKVVYKYEIGVHCRIGIPVGAEILTVQSQNNSVVMWAKVDTDYDLEIREFKIYGTGHEIDENATCYIGTTTVNGGAIVLHVFEITNCKDK